MSNIDFNNNHVLSNLDSYLEDKSYIEGFRLSPVDIKIFQEIKSEPLTTLPNLYRWYKHIKSYQDEFSKHPSNHVALEKYKEIFQLNSAENNGKVEEEIDLFGSDEEEDEETLKLKEQRLAMYAQRKSQKTQIIAKSSIVLDVKPWDTDTDMNKIDDKVRSIKTEGLVWGKSQLVPLAYGIKKLQITCVVEDDKVGTDYLEEKITEFEDLVQSVDIAAFNKI
ncbi:unnamed protein product [Gordionus sp. m RMFG-2023]|uniref:elongation factor 1-beta-like n=1 Tax=Gordionus sp. m RMFG-2023 TaxID=3053472 RepID=UPI0030DEDA50